MGGDPQEAVNSEGCVIVSPRALPRRVDGERRGLGARDRDIECGEGTVAGQQEAVILEGCCVNIASRDRARRGDAGR